MAEADYGVINGADFEKYVPEYTEIIKKYTPSDFPSDIHISCNNTSQNCDSYGNFSGANKLILKDGTLLAIYPVTDKTQATIIADINGLKAPNKYGRDIFMFTAYDNKKILPYGVGRLAGSQETFQFDRNFLLSGEYRSCRNDGLFCVGLIMFDGWEIKEDYPW